MLNGTTEHLCSFGKSSATHGSLVTAIWLQTKVSLAAGDTVELQASFCATDGFFAPDHTSFSDANIG